MVDYNKDMKAIFYTQTDEIEILDKNIRALMYFKNIHELADLINTSPRLVKALKPLLGA